MADIGSWYDKGSLVLYLRQWWLSHAYWFHYLLIKHAHGRYVNTAFDDKLVNLDG